jgi:hypothetical protein
VSNSLGSKCCQTQPEAVIAGQTALNFCRLAYGIHLGFHSRPMTSAPVHLARMVAAIPVNKSDNTLSDDGTSSRFEMPHASSLTATAKIDQKSATTTGDSTQTVPTGFPSIGQTSDPCATNPSNQDLSSGLQPTKTMQLSAGRVTSNQGPVPRQ